MMQKQSTGHSKPQSARWGRSRLITAALGLTLASVLIAIMGPFNTYGYGAFAVRFVYWAGLIFGAWILGEVVLASVRRFIETPLVLREAIVILIFVPIFMPMLIGWTTAILPPYTEIRDDPVLIALYLFAICVVISTARHGVPAIVRRNMMDQIPSDPRPRLHQRLPSDFKGDVLRLAADGHQVNVITTTGQFDIRMRLGDAILEMDCVRGFSVHRSHWVSETAIARECAKRGRPVLVLVNGDEVPVGAKYQPDLEAAGILSVGARGIETASA